MKRLLVGLVLLGLLSSYAFAEEKKPDPGTADKEKLAIKAAEAWLALSDALKYADCWEQSSNYFKNAVKKEKLNESMTAVRTPLGKMIKRTLTAQKYTKSLPGAPDGEYVVITYKTEFEKKKEAVETITPSLDKDGKWRVSGYFIK